MQTWTDERVELLKKLWADGLSASQIAGELGGMTRNAVIGKVHRLGLSGRAKAPSSSRAAPAQAARALQCSARRGPTMRGNTALAIAPAYDYEPGAGARSCRSRTVIPIGQRCTLIELTRASATGRSAIRRSPNSTSAAARRSPRPALLRLSRAASPISRRRRDARQACAQARAGPRSANVFGEGAR